MTEAERASAVAEFLAWPGPIRAGRRGRPTPLRTHMLASLMALAISLALALCSFALPLTAAAHGTWGAGAHLSLFCHLSL